MHKPLDQRRVTFLTRPDESPEQSNERAQRGRDEKNTGAWTKPAACFCMGNDQRAHGAGKVMTSVRTSRPREAYWQRFLKYPRLTLFRSRIELLHAALLEGEPAVTAFVPHPFRLRDRAGSDVPGCSLRRNGQRVAQVIARRDALSDTARDSLWEFFASHDMAFEVVTRDMIEARQAEARNWLYMVRRLLESERLDSAAREAELLRQLRIQGETTLGQLIGETARPRDEIVLFRLLHRGALHARLDRPLNADTRLSLPH